MVSAPEFDYAIIGGGFTAANLAIHINKYSKQKLKIAVISNQRPLGLGIAYSTQEAAHLLNVPAAKMSAFENEPNHFSQWLKDTQNCHTGDIGSYFAPRMVYGQYISDLLNQYVLPVKSNTIIEDEAVSIRTDKTGDTILLESGKTVRTRKVLFGLGNLAPVPLHIDSQSDPAAIQNPWNYEKIKTINPSSPVMIIGTGLTMVDIVLSLLEQNHAGTITAISRHGYLPREHAEPLFSPILTIDSPCRLRKLVNLFRNLPNRSSQWRQYVDGLRPYTQSLWQHFSHQEKMQFMRHLRAIWDVHRHRIAPQIHDKLMSAIHSDQLKICSGRIKNIARTKDQFVATTNNKKYPTVQAKVLVNCTGPSFMKSAKQSKLMQNLIKEHKLPLDELQMGFAINERYQPGCMPTTKPTWHFFGPITKGSLWEIIAVPDIRKQIFTFCESNINVS